jgi:hypothetical protein
MISVMNNLTAMKIITSAAMLVDCNANGTL